MPGSRLPSLAFVFLVLNGCQHPPSVPAGPPAAAPKAPPGHLLTPAQMEARRRLRRQVMVPLFFEASPGGRFVIRGGRFAAGFGPDGISAVVGGVVARGKDSAPTTKANAIRLRFEGAAPGELVGVAPLTAAVRVETGTDRKRWRDDVKAFDGLEHRGLYPGVRMLAQAHRGRLEYAFLLEPGADLRALRLSVDGVTSLKLDPRGDLVMQTSGGPIVQTRPQFKETIAGKSRALKGGFVLTGPTSYGFTVEGRTPGAPLVVDPELVFLTYFGGSQDEATPQTYRPGPSPTYEREVDVAFGADGNLFVTGYTMSANFPATAGAFAGGTDVFVLRLDPTQPSDQQLRYATFLGGNDFDLVRGIAPRPDGTVYLTGVTLSTDFPAATALGAAPAPQLGVDFRVAYVVSVDGNGRLGDGTFLGRAFRYHATAITYAKETGDKEGSVYVAGSALATKKTEDSDATPRAFQRRHAGGGYDGFVARLDAKLTGLRYLTYLGGRRSDELIDLAVRDGFAYVTGATTSQDFPVTAAAAHRHHGQAAVASCTGASPGYECFDAVVAKVSPDGHNLAYSTFAGGTGSKAGYGLAVSGNGQATIAGAFTDPGATQPTLFARRFDAGGAAELWTWRSEPAALGQAQDVAVDAMGNAHLTGTTFTDLGAIGLDTDSYHGDGDAFYAQLDASGNLTSMTYLGGSGPDYGLALDLRAGASGFCVAIGGSTASVDLPTVKPLPGETGLWGNSDLMLGLLCAGTPSASGSFVKEPAFQQVRAGDTGRFTLRFTNGTSTAVPITITDDVPTAVQVTGSTVVPRMGNRVHGTVNAQPGETAAVVQFRAGTQCPATVVNTAHVEVGGQTLSSAATVTIRCGDCGNGVKEPGEECDGGDGCRRNCTIIRCGDGVVDPGETCDDGNTSDGDDCTRDCRRPAHHACGSGSECAPGLVCGEACTAGSSGCDNSIFFHLGPLCIFGQESPGFCDTEFTCMPASEASHTR